MSMKTNHYVPPAASAACSSAFQPASHPQDLAKLAFSPHYECFLLWRTVKLHSHRLTFHPVITFHLILPHKWPQSCLCRSGCRTFLRSHHLCKAKHTSVCHGTELTEHRLCTTAVSCLAFLMIHLLYWLSFPQNTNISFKAKSKQQKEQAAKSKFRCTWCWEPICPRYSMPSVADTSYLVTQSLLSQFLKPGWVNFYLFLP